ncbi:MAG: helix-turn-helix transcriptional regulator [Firmicutes bacterium]|nr:helix-turn-helix transcriptional regulator [Bacillota bacterium]
MPNPFRHWREERGLTRMEMAVLLGTGVSQVQAVESGMPSKPFKAFVSAFAAVAGTALADKLVEEYATWREEQQAQVLLKLQEG